MNVLTPPRVVFDQEVEERIGTGHDDADFSGWYCIATEPFPCPVAGCDFVARFVTAAHHIVVWPESDDRQMLSVARDCREAGRNPRIQEYEPGFGPCITWDNWRRIGRPVHGKLEPPPGWDERTPRL